MEHVVRSFDEPDEVIDLPGLRSELVALGGLGLARTFHAPGWRWSVDLRPSVGTDRCETRHVGFAVAGSMTVELEDGREVTITAGEVYEIPPGHDAWVVSDVAFETVEWVGTRTWLRTLESLHDRVLVTLVVTDIVGSTRLAQRFGAEAWADLLNAFSSSQRDTATRFGGRTVKSTGDGSLVTVDGAARALRCAVAMRAAAAVLGLPLRCAVHSGEVSAAQGDVNGLAVHEAARMLAAAAGSTIVVSATTRALAADVGFDLVDAGEHELRGIGTRRLHTLRTDDASVDGPQRATRTTGLL